MRPLPATLKPLFRRFVLALSLCGSMIGHADNGYQRRLIDTLDRSQQSGLENVLNEFGGPVGRYPNRPLTEFVYGKLLMAGSIQWFSGTPKVSHQASTEVRRDEALVRWRYRRGPAKSRLGMLPANLLYPGLHRYVVLVDLGMSRMYVYENRAGHPTLIRDYYVSIGLNGPGKMKEGDQRTPVGVYRVTEFLSGSDLPDWYGAGAFPIDYPNALDRRRERTGHGIWLHGSPPDLDSRAPRASDGCVVLRNPDFKSLRNFVNPVAGTPVIIAEQVEWVTPEEVASRRDAVLSVLETRRRDWEGLDTERYLAHDSDNDFLDLGKDYRRRADHKRRVNAEKSFIQVPFGVLGLYAYPGEPNTVLVELDQPYISGNYRGWATKQQYWKHEPDGRWRVILEGRSDTALASFNRGWRADRR